MNIAKTTAIGSVMAIALIGGAQASVTASTDSITAPAVAQFTVTEQAAPAALQVAARTRVLSSIRLRSSSGTRTTVSGAVNSTPYTGTPSRGMPRVYNNVQRTLTQRVRIHM